METTSRDDARFPWTRFYEAFADRLLKFRDRRPALLNGIRDIAEERPDLPLAVLTDRRPDGSPFPLADICPFTVMALFNRGIRDGHRHTIAGKLAGLLKVKEAVPNVFAGIPPVKNRNTWFFPYADTRGAEDIDRLWEVFARALDLDRAGFDDKRARPFFAEAYDRALKVRGVKWNLATGLYWARPWTFPSLDGKSRASIENWLHIAIETNGPGRICNGDDYLKLADDLEARFADGNCPVHSHPELCLQGLSGQVPVEAAEAGARSGRRVPRAKPRIAEPEGGFSDKNEFGRRGKPLLPTYEEVLHIITELKNGAGAFPKSPIVVKQAKGSPRVCMKHYNRIYQECVDAAEQPAYRAAREAREDIGKQVAALCRDMGYVMGYVMLMPWADEGARTRLCLEMIAELPRLAGLAESADTERTEEEWRVLEKDGKELGSLRDAADKGELPELLRTDPVENLSRNVCAFCWFTPEEDEGRERLLRGLFEAEDEPDAELSAKREELARRVACDVCLPLASICPDRNRDGIVAIVGALPETAALFNGRVNRTLDVLLRCRREALLPKAADMFLLLARAGNTEGMARLFKCAKDFSRAIRDAVNSTDRLARLADTGQAAALLWILEQCGDGPDKATAGEVLRRIFAGDAGRRPWNEEAKRALGGCIAALLQRGAELDDDMRARLESGELAPAGETRRIRALDDIRRKLEEAEVAPENIRRALRQESLINLFASGIGERLTAEEVRKFMEGELEAAEKRHRYRNL